MKHAGEFMLEINSKTNKTYKMLSALHAKKGRQEHGLYTVEGLKSVKEALDAAAAIQLLVVTKAFAQMHPSLLKRAENNGASLCCLDKDLFAKISDTKTPAGVLCTIKLPQHSLPALKHGLYIYCDHIADPGNAGTIIRTADAVGANAVLFSPECVDIYNPKVIRSTMGSFFHIETYTDVNAAILTQAKAQGFRTVAGALTPSATDAREITLPHDTVLVIGNESNGVSASVLEICETHAILPIAGKAESLNAAAAAAVFMYKWLFEQK